MLNNRGQLTLFIIIAIVIVGAVVLFFAFRGGIKVDKLNPDAEEVYFFIEECLNDVGAEAVYEIGVGGGYYISPEFSTDTEIPYYYDSLNKTNYMPSRERVEQEIEEYIEGNMVFCTRNFVDFFDVNITSRDMNADVKILEDKILLDVNYPVSVAKEESSSSFNEFNGIEIPVRLGIIYDSIEEVMQEQLRHEDVCLSCLLDVAQRNDLLIDTVDYDDETIVFVFIDENSKINNEAFEFLYANRYVK